MLRGEHGFGVIAGDATGFHPTEPAEESASEEADRGDGSKAEKSQNERDRAGAEVGDADHPAAGTAVHRAIGGAVTAAFEQEPEDRFGAGGEEAERGQRGAAVAEEFEAADGGAEADDAEVNRQRARGGGTTRE